MTNSRKKPIVIVIDDSNVEDTEKYINALKKYVLELRKSVTITGTYLNPVVKDDEEARSSATQLNAITYALGLIENRKKAPGQKLPTPKAIKCFLQKALKNEIRTEENGLYGEIETFIIDLVDSELYADTQLNLFPTPENITHEDKLLKLEVMRILKDVVLNQKKNAKKQKLTTNKIVEIVLSKKKDLAKKDDLTKIADLILRSLKY